MGSTANSVADQAYLGVNINWAIGLTDYTITGVGMHVQSSDTSLNYEKYEVKNQRGAVVGVVYYNPTDTATIEYIVTASGAASGNAALTYPTHGTKITVGASSDDPLSGSNWLVDDVSVRRTNTDAAKINLKLMRYKNIA